MYRPVSKNSLTDDMCKLNMLHILQGANREKEYIATQGICFRLNTVGLIF